MAFCHKKLDLLNKRVSTQSMAPKLKAWGKRQDLPPAVLCFVFCIAAQSALCAPVPADTAARLDASEPTNDALLKARELGTGEGSVEGLQSLIKQRQPKLIEFYGQFLGGWSYSKLSPGIEALITQNMNDPVIGPALLRLTLKAKYQTTKLFELLDARIARAPAPDWVALSAISRTDLPEIEPEVLKLAERFPASQFDKNSVEVLRFFGERKYAPAVPFLRAVIQGRKPSDSAAISVAEALVKIGTPLATTAVIDRLEWLARQPSGAQGVQNEINTIMYALSNMTETAPLDFPRLKKTLSGKMPQASRRYLLEIAQKRKELEAVPDFLNALVEEPQSAISNPAFKALLGYDSIDVWRKTRAEIEHLYRAKEISDVYHASALRTLDERLKEPEKYLAESRQASRDKVFYERQAQIDSQKPGLQTLKASDPEKYVVAQQQYLEKLGKLSKEYEGLGATVGLQSRIANDYFLLGSFVRFKMKQPAKAVPLFEHAPDSLMAQIAAADTMRFGLRDSASAIRYYEKALAAMKDDRMTGNSDLGMTAWMRVWIDHEIAYLKTGKTFTGRLAEDDLAGFIFFSLFGAAAMQGADVELSPDSMALAQSVYQGKTVSLDARNKLAKEIEKLPASHFSLFSSMAAATMLPNATVMLHYLGKHDPAGYLTASLLGTIDTFNRQPVKSDSELALLPGVRVDPEMLKLVSNQFFKAHQIVLNTGPDPRMASPEKTWMLFIEALKNGDMNTAQACLAPAMKAKLEPLFAASNSGDLKNMAESFSRFAVSEGTGQYREAVVTRGNRVGFIYFANIGGSWKIQEM